MTTVARLTQDRAAAKVVNDLLFVAQTAAAAEALTLGTHAGLNPVDIASVFDVSSARSFAFNRLADRALRRDFLPGEPIDLSYQNARHGLILADELDVPVPLGAQAQNVLRSARGMGLGSLDLAAVIQVYEAALARELDATPRSQTGPTPSAAPPKVARIGFVGIGTMGRVMCRHLIERSGAEVAVFDLNREAVASCVAQGAQDAGSLTALAAESDVIFSSLPMPRDVEAVALGEDGIAAHARPGTVWVETSTSSIALARRLSAELSERGITLLDSPVSGSISAGEAGELVVFVGGDATTFRRLLPLYQTYGSSITRLGPTGAGLLGKLVSNMLLFANIAAGAEALMLGTAAGVDPSDLATAIMRDTGESVGFRAAARRALHPDDPTKFPLDLAYKDIRLALELADEVSVPTPLASEAHMLMRSGRALGLGQSDATGLVRVYESILGRTVAGAVRRTTDQSSQGTPADRSTGA